MNCKYITKNGRCGLKGCYAYKHTCYTIDFCKYWEPPTHADRIRAMSDEELAAFLDALCTDGSCSVCDNHHWCRRNNAPEPICKNHICGWLKQPVREE